MELAADLQQQLHIAAQVQRSLLPKKHCCFSGWKVGYDYQPAGFVTLANGGMFSCDVDHTHGGKQPPQWHVCASVLLAGVRH